MCFKITYMTSTQETIDNYFACWNATTEDGRQEAVNNAWGENAQNTDPMGQQTGHKELTEMFAGTQAIYPGHTFRQVGAVDAHHDLLRWGWEMIDGAGSQVLDGIDIGTVDTDGRLTRVNGFFGAQIPAAS